jgi:hypothetical protein
VCGRAQALRSRDGAKLGPEHKDTPYHKDYLEAESEEDKRNAAFAAQIEKVSTCPFSVLMCGTVHMLIRGWCRGRACSLGFSRCWYGYVPCVGNVEQKRAFEKGAESGAS